MKKKVKTFQSQSLKNNNYMGSICEKSYTALAKVVAKKVH